MSGKHSASYVNPLEMLWTSADYVLDPRSLGDQRKTQIRSFIKVLSFADVSLYDFENVIARLGIGQFYGRGEGFKSPQALLGALHHSEREQLRGHLRDTVGALEKEFPDLTQEFQCQFKRPPRHDETPGK